MMFAQCVSVFGRMRESGSAFVLSTAACMVAASAATAQPLPEAWRSWGNPPVPSGDVYAFTMWDPDGSGPLQPQLVVGGAFTTINGVTVNRVARWDGLAWQPLGSGVNAAVNALTSWDPDGSGPLPAQLVAAGWFTTAGGTLANYIARWDGSAWQPLGSGLGSIVQTLATWDPDGSGPLPQQLVAGGNFTMSGAATMNHVARWDGSSWQQLGLGVSGNVLALATWDPDGTGPLPEKLVVGGSFVAALPGVLSANSMASWDGSAWQPFGTGVSGPVNALTLWDPDGDGPLPEQLIVGGNFLMAGGMNANRVARWDGAAWQPLGLGVGAAGVSSVRALASWDPDGTGPQPVQLAAGGDFIAAGGVTVHYVARWSGTSWQPLSTGTNGAVDALMRWDPDGAGPIADQLVAGGAFNAAGGAGANNLAVWGTFDPRNPGAGFGCDVIDFNGDGLFPDTLDIEDFLSVFAGGPCSNAPNCADVDFNNDGLFPDTLDIDALLSVFAGGACLR